jgi:hypothetical protein
MCCEKLKILKVDYHDKTLIWPQKQDHWDRTTRTGPKRQDHQNRTTRTGPKGQGQQDRTTRTEPPRGGQPREGNHERAATKDINDRSLTKRQTWQDYSDRIAMAVELDRIAKRGQDNNGRKPI